MEKDYISAYEYEKNVNPDLTNIPFYEKNINDCNYGINIIDFSNVFNIAYKSTTPNLLASFIKLTKNDTIELNNTQFNEFNATSHLFYIINGKASIHVNDNDEQFVFSGDILINPCFSAVKIKNLGEDELQIYYINDSPLVNYLGSRAEKRIFKFIMKLYKHFYIL